MIPINSIDIFPWNENFNTGLDEIDAQHKKLVQLLNLLASHVAFGIDLPALNSIFEELADYAVYHFQTEEAVWRQYFLDEPIELQHKIAHDDFVKTVQKLKEKQSAKPTDAMLEQVLIFLIRWLATHILQNDRYLASIVLAMQSGMSLDDAQKCASEKMHRNTNIFIDIILSIYETLSTNSMNLMRELNQRKLTEDSMRKLSLAVEQSPSAIVITDVDAKIEFVNEAFLKATGFTRAEVGGENPRILQSGKTSKATYQQMWDTLVQGKPWKGEFINKRKDGDEYVELAHISPIYQLDGIVTHYLAIKEDITERKNLERKLVEQLAFTEAIIDAEIDGIAVYHYIDKSPFVCFTVWNSSIQALTGYSQEEINHLGWYQTIYNDPGIQERAKQRMARVCLGEHVQGEEWPISTKAGAQRIVQIYTVQCSLDSQGSHILVVMHDITEQIRIEKALRKSHQNMDLLLNSMPEGAYGLDLEGNCTFVNRSFLRILGFESVDEVLGKHIHTLIHHSYPDCSIYPVSDCRIYAAYRNNEQIHVENEVFWRKDGTSIPVEYWLQPISNDGIVVGAIATLIDISERKKSEEVILQAAHYARSLIEASLDPLVTVNTGGKITDVNTATEQVTGVPRNLLIGSDFASYFTDPEKAREGYQQAFTQGFVTDYPLAVHQTTGKVTEVIYNASVYRDRNNNVLGVFAAARDITERKQMEAKLIASEAHLRAIIENEPECIKIVDAEGYIQQMNPAGLTTLEADNPEQVIGMLVFDVIAPEHREAFINLHKRVIAGERLQMEYEIIGLKGRRYWMETHAVPMRTASGEIVQLAVTRDITIRKQAEHQLRIAATVFESREGMMVTDAKSIILRVNKAFTEITGYSAEEIVGKNPRELQSKRHNQFFYAEMWECIAKSGAWEGEIWNRRKNGDVYPEYLSINAVKDSDGRITHYVGTFTDITLKKLADEEIERLAFYDPLTDLPNRRLLQDRLKTALAVSQRTGIKGALLFIDLDNFKTLNDTLGHDMGDLLLQQVATRLKTCIRESDTVARLGGDEFVVMLEDLSENLIFAAEMAEEIGHKILKLFNVPFKLDVHDYMSSPSIGATLFEGQKQSIDEILKHADIAMYQAKKAGRNSLCFFELEMQDAVVARAALENELRIALEQQQFYLHYQVQMKNANQPIGAEALIRWRHPDQGLVPPSKFIALAESNGMILAIGQWVLDTACAQIKNWQQNPCTRDLSLSVNISPKQFFQTDFVKQIRTTLKRHAINPISLKLELTENILIENIDEAIATMNTLGSLGVQFSLDDFGTGYSSLQYLKKLPLNQLKIDQSFIRDISMDTNDQAIVSTIIAMAKSLNLDVIAEGVETHEQRQFLFDNGCSYYQGYLFGKPMTIEKFDSQWHHLKDG